MGIDLRYKHRKTATRQNLKSQDVYLRLLVRLYRFLARRTGSDFNKVVLKRLIMSNKNRPSVSIRKVAKALQGKEGKTAVVAGTVTDDLRLTQVPKLTVVALRFTETVRARIEKAGGKCMTFDQLAVQSPKGSNTVLVRGNVSAREAQKHFGAAGLPGSHAKPFVGSKGNHRA